MNKKQQRFCQEYVIDHNATQAAIRAGYSEHSARITASKLLTKANIAGEVSRLEEEIAERCKIDAEKVLNELAKIAFSDVGKLFSGGALMSVTEVDDDTRAAIASIEVVQRTTGSRDDPEVEYTSKIKTWDKIKALELIGKHLGFFADPTSITNNVQAAQVIFAFPDNKRDPNLLER
jgi:phage terminase small subunit